MERIQLDSFSKAGSLGGPGKLNMTNFASDDLLLITSFNLTAVCIRRTLPSSLKITITTIIIMIINSTLISRIKYSRYAYGVSSFCGEPLILLSFLDNIDFLASVSLSEIQFCSFSQSLVFLQSYKKKKIPSTQNHRV